MSSVPSGLPSSRNWTPTTPRSSLAVALTATPPETVAPPAGALIATCGGVVSCGGGADVVKLHVSGAASAMPSAARIAVVSVATYVVPSARGWSGVTVATRVVPS